MNIHDLIITILAALLPEALKVFKHPRDSLAYAFSEQVELISQHRIDQSLRAASSLVVKYKGQEVSNVFVFECRLENIGNTDITKEQISIPVTLEFPLGVRLLDVSLVKKIPECMKVTVNSDLNDVTVDFPLLNPGNRFYLLLVCEGPITIPQIKFHMGKIRKLVKMQWGYRVRRPIITIDPILSFFASLILTFFIYIGCRGLVGIFSICVFGRDLIPYFIIYLFLFLFLGFGLISDFGNLIGFVLSSINKKNDID